MRSVEEVPVGEVSQVTDAQEQLLQESQQALARPPTTSGVVPAPVEIREEDFERLQVIGTGAFATVWKARHRLTGTNVALKVGKSLPPGDDRLADLHAETAAREVMVMEWLLGLPGVVQLIGRYRHDGGQ